ncbi:sensor domain-containing diguanylate cyclase [Saccharospirillum mangrovi]|uniref:GGDEF domain-containing protein n=1 Tax=Saccharospirillum mangrovi TaxID=2161747 RepID=UPI0013003C5A|nr:GGDEF domain-containing protein [Saccharospirillum mangrovi]
MSESPLYRLSSAFLSHFDGLAISPATWVLLATAVLAMVFHRTAWLTLLLVLLTVCLSQEMLTEPGPALAVWLAWLWAFWRPDKPLRLTGSWLPLAILLIMALWPWLPFLPANIQQWPNVKWPDILPIVNVSPVILTLIFLSGLSALFRFVLKPSASWPWHGLGVLLTAILSWQGEQAASLVWIALSLVIGATILTDAYSVAYRDALTNIPNRRALSQALRTLGRRYAIAMADVDHFKSFNDTWGHETGDQVLKVVASILTKHHMPVRAFRYGGEEFTLVFRGMTREEATPILDELRERIAEYPLMVRKSDRPTSRKDGKRQRGATTSAKQVNISASFGVSDNRHAHSPEDAIQRADKALYKAKQAGRNCVRSG